MTASLGVITSRGTGVPDAGREPLIRTNRAFRACAWPRHSSPAPSAAIAWEGFRRARGQRAGGGAHLRRAYVLGWSAGRYARGRSGTCARCREPGHARGGRAGTDRAAGRGGHPATVRVPVGQTGTDEPGRRTIRAGDEQHDRCRRRGGADRCSARRTGGRDGARPPHRRHLRRGRCGLRVRVGLGGEGIHRNPAAGRGAGQRTPDQGPDVAHGHRIR